MAADTRTPTEQDLAERQRLFGEVIAKFHGDPAYKAKMLKDPTGTLRAEGIPIPPGATVKLLMNTDNLIHLVLPYRAPS